MSTGDFTHPAWRDELRRDLVYDDNSGLYRVREKTPLETEIPGFSRPEGVSEPQFLIQAEISSIYKKNGKVFVRSGAGIVADSDPEKEFQECINKAKASLKALEVSQEVEE